MPLRPAALLCLLALAQPSAARATETPAERSEILTLWHDAPGLPTVPLAGLLIRPARSPPYPAVILLDDGLGLDERVFTLADALLWRGWAVLQIELRPRSTDGVGPPGANPLGDWADGGEGVLALHGLLARLAEDAEIAPARIAAVGWGLGGRTALLAGAEAEATAALGPFGPRFAAHAALYPGCHALAREGHATDEPWSAAPVAVLEAGRDGRDPPGACEALRRGLAAAGRAPRLWQRYPLAGYGWDYSAGPGGVAALPVAPGRRLEVRQDTLVTEDATERLLRFLAETLDPPAPPSGQAIPRPAPPDASR